jgi:hypothetical protein
VDTVARIGGGNPPLTAFPHECRFCGYRRVRLCPGASFGMTDAEKVLDRLRRDRFRARFRLHGAERAGAVERGMTTILEHAGEFIRERLAPAVPANDGRQTPWRGHPVFVAQHATATCCRSCLEREHHISRGRPLNQDEQGYIADLIQRWLARELADQPADRAQGESPGQPAAGEDPPSRESGPGPQFELF